MRIQYGSDLHLEFKDNFQYLELNPIQPEAEILILAGDIVPIAQIGKYNDFFDDLSRKFRTVYWLPGNHEYYHSDIAGYENPYLIQVRKNVYLLDQKLMRIGGVELIFSTLWSHIGTIHRTIIEQGVTDFYCIKYKGRKFTPELFNMLHNRSLNFVQEAVQKHPGAKKIVISHHVPSLKHYPVPFLHSEVNEAFAVDLDSYIETTDIRYWIYGHHHTNIPEFKVGKTSLVTNQLGYVRQGEHQYYKPACVLEIA